MSKNFKYVLWVLLLAAGFMVGVAWKNTDKKTEEPAPIEANDEDLISNKGITEDMLDGLKPVEKSTIKLFEQSSPSVAYITTSTLRENYYTRNVVEIPKGSGSGFIWDDEGHIVTNYHVIKDASRFKVQLSSQQEAIEAELVGVAPSKDLAVIKLKTMPVGLKPLPVGGSENLLVGQSVLAIGNPFGLDYTLTTGIISALGREIQGTDGTPIKDVIQTDAAINPGNSGGPLLNSSGELIGVNTAIYSPSGAYAGIGFAIPVDIVKWVIPELIQYGKIKRPTLGISIASARVMAQLREEGILVIDVERGSAAANAGIQATKRDRYGDIILGDIIVGIDDNEIKKYGDLVLALEKYKPGDEVKVKVKRDDEVTELDLTLDEAK